ncbi:MAG: efflux RND transporter periplasmic adaptor subunit [Verrucomicrobiota bacterium]
MTENSSGSNWLKRAGFLAGAILLVGGGVWWYQKNHSAPAQYITVDVTRGDLTQVVTATGNLNPVVNVAVGSQISGIVRKLYVDFNSTVKSNQLIAEIDPATYQSAVYRAQADLANAKATQELNRIQARRAIELFTNDLISASDHDTAVAQMHVSDAQVQSAEATLRNAQIQLSYCTIYAPVDGVVISRAVDVGQTVAASFNTPTIFQIANDLTKMQIHALVSEADIGNVATNQNVDFTVDAYPFRTFHGIVSQIRYGPVTNQNVINYDSVIDVNNADSKLLPGMTANVSIITAERKDALKLPNAALRFRPPPPAGAARTNAAATAGGPGAAGAGAAAARPGGGAGAAFGGGAGGGSRAGAQRPDRSSHRTVYVLKGDPDHPELEPVQIRTGITDGISTEVLEGLKEGDKVVTAAMTSESDSQRPVNPFGGGGGFPRR